MLASTLWVALLTDIYYVVLMLRIVAIILLYLLTNIIILARSLPLSPALHYRVNQKGTLLIYNIMCIYTRTPLTHITSSYQPI